MKKLNLLFVGLLLGIAVIAQPVIDNAIIPVSVNLNSILRMNVTSGGNIEFTVNNMSQYTLGITNSDRYDTKFTVASSVDFDVLMYAEGDLIGSDLATHAMPVENIAYTVEVNGGGTEGANWDIVGAAVSPSVLTELDVTPTFEIVSGIANNAAGDIAQNAFIINWELATTPGIATTNGVGSLLSQSLPPDRYTTNVFLVLQPTP